MIRVYKDLVMILSVVFGPRRMSFLINPKLNSICLRGEMEFSFGQTKD